MAFQWLLHTVAQFATFLTEKEKLKSNQFWKSRENQLVLFIYESWDFEYLPQLLRCMIQLWKNSSWKSCHKVSSKWLLVKGQNIYCWKTSYQHQGASWGNTNLLLLEHVCVFAQTKLAEELRQIRSLKQTVEVTAIASCQRGDAVHVVTATEIVFGWKGTSALFRHITEGHNFPPTLYSASSLNLQSIQIFILQGKKKSLSVLWENEQHKAIFLLIEFQCLFSIDLLLSSQLIAVSLILYPHILFSRKATAAIEHFLSLPMYLCF